MSFNEVYLFLIIFLINLLRGVKFVIIIVILLSWFQVEQNKFTQFLTNIASPVLNIFRKITPKTEMLDLSPLFAFIVIDLLQYLLEVLLYS